MTTGLFIRVGTENKELERCTPEELEEFFNTKDKDELVRWCLALVKSVQELSWYGDP